MVLELPLALRAIIGELREAGARVRGQDRVVGRLAAAEPDRPERLPRVRIAAAHRDRALRQLRKDRGVSAGVL